MDRIRIGIIGCGEVAQIVHLPALFQLCDRFQVTAICDVSASVIERVGNQWGIPQRYTDYRDLVDDANVDAVLVTSPHVYHTLNVLAAIAAGKHVLVEKPLCFTLAETDAISEATERAGVTVQVAYMRRYVAAFEEACQLVHALPEIRLARVHDIIGRNASIIEKTSYVIRGNDISESVLQAGRDLQREMLDQALGPVPNELERAYMMMLGLATHDVSAMRELLGLPAGVLYAAQRRQGNTITAALDYENFVCHLEIGVDDIPRYDTYLQVYGGDKIIHVQFDTPYVRNLPNHLMIKEADETGRVTDSAVHPGWGDPFVAEWRAFYDNVTQKRTPKTSPQDARHDLELFLAMIQLMKGEPAAAL